MADRSLQDITIAGTRLRVRTSLNDEKVSQLVDLVDSKVKSAMKRSNSKSYHKALILAALNIAEELLTLKNQVRNELDTLEDRARDVLTELESTEIGISI
ncbi:MAG: hypothetical protein A4S09_03000 [Proteobacteria bacterium SG_bin7]|nr:MAG: hypothetical protein A4S09_03000 [Proteobacteria bacterium SG_bin7]